MQIIINIIIRFVCLRILVMDVISKKKSTELRTNITKIVSNTLP